MRAGSEVRLVAGHGRSRLARRGAAGLGWRKGTVGLGWRKGTAGLGWRRGTAGLGWRRGTAGLGWRTARRAGTKGASVRRKKSPCFSALMPSPPKPQHACSCSVVVGTRRTSSHSERFCAMWYAAVPSSPALVFFAARSVAYASRSASRSSLSLAGMAPRPKAASGSIAIAAAARSAARVLSRSREIASAIRAPPPPPTVTLPCAVSASTK